MYKYQQLMKELGYADESAVSAGFREKIKKFNAGVAEYNRLSGLLADTTLSDDRRKNIEQELSEVNVESGDEVLCEALRKYHKNKDVYASNAANLALARKGGPAKTPPAPAPTPQPKPKPAAAAPAPTPAPAPAPQPAPVPPPPPAPETGPTPPIPEQNAEAGGVVEQKDLSGWALAGIAILSILGLGMWAKSRRG